MTDTHANAGVLESSGIKWNLFRGRIEDKAFSAGFVPCLALLTFVIFSSREADQIKLPRGCHLAYRLEPNDLRIAKFATAVHNTADHDFLILAEPVDDVHVRAFIKHTLRREGLSVS